MDQQATILHSGTGLNIFFMQNLESVVLHKFTLYNVNRLVGEFSATLLLSVLNIGVVLTTCVDQNNARC